MSETKTFTITISNEALEALTRITEDSELGGLLVSRNVKFTYVLLSYERLKAQKLELEAKVEQLLLGKTGGKAPTMSYMEKKAEREKAERERAIGLCEQLDGRVDGDICIFKKYEITAGGLIVDNVVSENIYNLSDKTVDEQYYPSKPQWLKAKKEDDAKEEAKRQAQAG